MVELVARKAIGRTKAGERIRVRSHEARALRALGLADNPPPAAEQQTASPRGSKREYKRRDMVAEQYEPKFIDAPALPAKVAKTDGAPFSTQIKIDE